MRRAETITRVVCLLLGVALAVGAVVLFVVVIRLGPRASLGALVGAAAIAVPAFFLIRRGLTGQDVDRYDLQDIADRNMRIRWWGR
jgi:hypothetical protein